MKREEAVELACSLIIATRRRDEYFNSDEFDNAEYGRLTQEEEHAKNKIIAALTTPATVLSEAIKPGRRYLVTRTITQECEIRQGIDGTGLWVRRINYSGSSVGWSLPLSVLVDKGAIFEPIDTKEPV